MSAAIKTFWRDEQGATAIEYALLGVLVAVAIAGTFTVLGNSLMGLFNTPTSVVISSTTANLNRN